MCRLFGFRSVIESQVHRSLLDCDNALVRQSERHCDGWGVAYYMRGVPHVIKSARSAVEDSLFARVSGIVSAQTVIAHLRLATTGNNSMVNCHPFQFGRWVFAHNGQIPEFEAHRPALLAQIDPNLRRFVLGETDSEVLFYMLLSLLEQRIDLSQPNPPLASILEALEQTIAAVHQITGQNCYVSRQKEDLYLSFLVSNGQIMIGHQGGKPLFFSTHKNLCAERDTCASFGRSCEAPTRSGPVNHLVLTSEPLLGDNVWSAMSPGQTVAVDGAMNLQILGQTTAAPASMLG